MYCIVLLCTMLWCIALYFTILPCTVLYCTNRLHGVTKNLKDFNVNNSTSTGKNFRFFYYYFKALIWEFSIKGILSIAKLAYSSEGWPWWASHVAFMTSYSEWWCCRDTWSSKGDKSRWFRWTTSEGVRSLIKITRESDSFLMKGAYKSFFQVRFCKM